MEADGSAYFAVPSDRFVYFQLLDEDGMMIQSMRSGTIVQSGERVGCVGCHDERRAAPPAADRHDPAGPEAGAEPAGGLARPAPDVQLSDGGPAGVRQALRPLPRLRQRRPARS